MTYIPEEDGVTHINVYSKGLTSLGRFLSNFAQSPFTHPIYGSFASVEGFWYWLKTGKKHAILRTLYGWKAKDVGKGFEEEYCENFDNIIKTAIRAKLIANPTRLRELIECPLPLAHYYVYNGIVVEGGYEWITSYIDEIRSACIAKGWKP